MKILYGSRATLELIVDVLKKTGKVGTVSRDAYMEMHVDLSRY
ncbi:MAG: hypothetical protein ACFHHU_14370 [Porticoccaceae bacterium]